MNLPGTISARRFIQFYAAFVILGTYPFARSIISILSKYIFSPFHISVYPNVAPYFYPGKKVELVGYLLCSVIIPSYALIIGIILRAEEIDGLRPVRPIVSIPLVAVLSLALWLLPPMGCATLWCLLAAFPVLRLTIARYLIGDRCIGMPRYLGPVSAAVLAAMLFPLLFCKPRIGSEYLNIPTTTLMGHGTEAVDTDAMFDGNVFFGMQKTGLGAGRSADMSRFPFVEVSDTSNLDELLRTLQGDVPERIIDAVRRNSDFESWNSRHADHSINPDPIEYVDGRLYAINSILPETERRLENAVNPEDRPKIQRLSDLSSQYEEKIASHHYTAMEREFISDNASEIESSILARHIFHHQNFVLGPIQESASGRPDDQINFQYGYLPIKMLRGLLEISGGISYGSFIHATYAFFPIYILGSWGIIYLITRDALISSIYFCMNVAILGFIGYENISIAPGMNPLRHLFDTTVLFLLLMHLRSGRNLLLLPLYSISIISIYFNMESGLALLLAVAAVLGFKRSLHGQGTGRIPIPELLLSLLGCLLAFKFQPGKNELAQYYFEGLLGFPTHIAILLGFICICSLGYLVVIALWNRLRTEERYCLLFLLLYSQMMFIYYVWGGSKYHFLNYASIYGLTLLYIIHISIGRYQFRKIALDNLRSLAVLSSYALLLLGAFVFFYQEKRSLSIFSNHITHEWKMPKARIITTMDEEPFEKSVELIRKFEKEKGIYIISEYDNMLPFLADKYSAMPYPDLQWFINSDSEERQVIEELSSKRPKFLFTDALLMRDLAFESMDANVPLFGLLQAESLMRVQRIRALQRIFSSVKDSYDLVATDGLLSVWQHKSN